MTSTPDISAANMQRSKRNFSRLGATSSQNKLPGKKVLESLRISLSGGAGSTSPAEGPSTSVPQVREPVLGCVLLFFSLNLICFLPSSLHFPSSFHIHTIHPLRYSSMVFSVQSCTTITTIDLRIFLAPLKEPPNFSQSPPCLPNAPLSPAPGNH